MPINRYTERALKSRPRHPPELRCITRCDRQRARGWWVRVDRGGDVAGRFFSDGLHGGREKALCAAQRHRDALVRSLPAPALGRWHLRRTAPRVYRETRSYRHWTTGELVYYEAWAVWGRDRKTGRPVHTAYSIAKHGDAGARALAYEFSRRRF